MKRTHITIKPMKKVRRETRPQEIDHKPKGFWYGIDGDWERWCKGEDWGLSKDKENLEYELVLADENILMLSSVVEIDKFHELYEGSLSGILALINWKAVAEKYDGIEIAPYQWNRRFEGTAHHWYYGWDCASGCIWRPKGCSVKLAGKVKV
jgi:hypothetical protein